MNCETGEPCELEGELNVTLREVDDCNTETLSEKGKVLS